MNKTVDQLAEQLTAEQDLRKKEQEKRKALTQQVIDMHAYIQKGNSFVAPPPFTPEKAPAAKPVLPKGSANIPFMGK